MGDVKITSYNQSGGITAQNVNIGAQQRRLDDANRRQLLSLIPKSQKVVVSGALGDGESCSYAQEIMDYLVGQGYEVEGVNQCVWMPPVKGQGIVNGKDPWEIQIGHHPG